MENRLEICLCIELAFFFNGTYRYDVLLQVWFSILVVVPFKVHYIINLPTKHVLVAISSNSILIRSQNTGCCQVL